MSITGILTYLFVLTVLVFFHELGHFLFAKAFKMKVEDFSLGFGEPKWQVWHDGETAYHLRAFPLGGFVRIKGMEIEDAAESRLTGAQTEPAPDHGFETTNISTMGQEAQEVDGAKSDGFNTRPIYQRFWVIFGGPLFSFLFGWLMFCLTPAIFGVPDDATQTTVIEQVVGGKPASRAGIHAGDTVTAVDDVPVSDGKAMVDAIHAKPNVPLTLTVRTPKNETRTVTLTPESLPDPAHPGKTIGIVGIMPGIVYSPPKRLSLSESFEYGNRTTLLVFQAMGALFASPKQFSESVGGPVEILKASSQASKSGASHVALLIAQLSLSLGLFNLFPIPVLDGGHLMLMALEKIRGRKLTAEQTQRVLLVGMVFIGSIAVFIIGRGVLRLFIP